MLLGRRLIGWFITSSNHANHKIISHLTSRTYVNSTVEPQCRQALSVAYHPRTKKNLTQFYTPTESYPKCIPVVLQGVLIHIFEAKVLEFTQAIFLRDKVSLTISSKMMIAWRRIELHIHTSTALSISSSMILVVRMTYQNNKTLDEVAEDTKVIKNIKARCYLRVKNGQPNTNIHLIESESYRSV